MSHDYLTGYLPDSGSRLRHERKKALRNVLIIAVVIAAFFYVLTKAVRILVEDNRIVNYPISVKSDANSDKVSPDEIIYYDVSSEGQAKVNLDTIELDKEIVRTNQEIEKLTEQVPDKKVSNQQVFSQQPLVQENNNQKIVEQEPSSEPDQPIVSSTTSVEQIEPLEKSNNASTSSNTSSDTDDANSQYPIDLKDLEAIYNKQLSTILDDN
jgi:hypothetical protein